MKLRKILILLMLVMVSTSTFAARGYYDDPYDQRSNSRSSAGSNSQFYMGAGVGSMKTDIPSVNTNAISWALFAGTSINRFLSAEVAYTNFGSTDLGASSYLKGTAYSLNLVGNIPVTSFVELKIICVLVILLDPSNLSGRLAVKLLKNILILEQSSPPGIV